MFIDTLLVGFTCQAYTWLRKANNSINHQVVYTITLIWILIMGSNVFIMPDMSIFIAYEYRQ